MYRPCYAPVFPPSDSRTCAARTVGLALLLVFLIVLLALTLGSETVLCMIRQTAFRIRHCRDGNDAPDLDIGFTLDRWIRETSKVGRAIVWRPDGRTELRYADWPRADKQRLAALFSALESTGTADLPVEPAISEFRYAADTNPDGEHKVVSVSYEASIARDTFFAHVAQSLRVEIRRLTSWSVQEFTDAELALLFDSRHMLEWDSTQRRHVLFMTLGMATPGDPGRIYRWLTDHAMVGDSARASILGFLEWCRGLSHDGAFLNASGSWDVYPGSRRGNEAHWQYEGFQPVERTLAGTYRLASTTLRHWTHGCQGTTGLLRNVLRTINIPVTREDGCDHAIPHFVRARAFLSHGDDPYTLHMREWTPVIPMAEILIPVERLPRFFDNCDHVGRGVLEAVVRLLPDQLLELHCQDLEAGASRAAGQVYAQLRPYLTMDELNAMRFWERLDEKVARRGGCGAVI